MEKCMLEFVFILFPGIIISYVVEYLMHKKVTRHQFIFLCVFNILALNFAVLLFRPTMIDRLIGGGYISAMEDENNAKAAILQVIYSFVAGVPLSIAEAFTGKIFSARLEDVSKRDEDSHEPKEKV